MAFISLDNLKKNMNIGWAILIAYLVIMLIVFLVTTPVMVMGAEIYATVLILLLIGLAMKD